MKFLSMLTWVTQFGFSIFFPPCLLLMLAVWLQDKYGWGNWIVFVCGILGLLIAFSSARSGIRSLLKAAEENSPKKEDGTAFNDHN